MGSSRIRSLARGFGHAAPRLLITGVLSVLWALPGASLLPVLAQEATGSIRGVVFLVEGGARGDAGVGGVTVTLTDGRMTAVTNTAGDGSFRFVNLTEGSYTVRVEPPEGYRRTTDAAIATRITAGETVRADFGLARTPTATATSTQTPTATVTPSNVPTATPTARSGAPAATTQPAAEGAQQPRETATPPGGAPTAESATPTVAPETTRVPEVARAVASPEATGTPPTLESQSDDRDTPSEGFAREGVLVPAASPSPELSVTPTATLTPTPTPNPAPPFRTVAGERTQPGPPTWPRYPPPIEAATLDEYLQARGSPMAGLGEALLDAGWRYNVDPRLLVAIAGADTGFGRVLCTDYNAWNWFWFGWCNSPFESWVQGMEEVARGLRVGYLDAGRTDVDTIAERYGPLDDPRDTLGLNRYWPGNVTRYLQDLGGSRCNLTWVQADVTCAPPRPTATARPTMTPTATPSTARQRSSRRSADTRRQPRGDASDQSSGGADELHDYGDSARSPLIDPASITASLLTSMPARPTVAIEPVSPGDTDEDEELFDPVVESAPASAAHTPSWSLLVVALGLVIVGTQAARAGFTPSSWGHRVIGASRAYWSRFSSVRPRFLSRLPWGRRGAGPVERSTENEQV